VTHAEHAADGDSTFWRLMRSPAVKLFSIGFIVLVLMIPLLMVWGLLSDRERRADDVAGEISNSWGGPQRLAGPFLVVPFHEVQKSVNGDKVTETVVKRHMVFLPDELRIEGRADGRTLQRSIFEVAVYEADLRVSGRFQAPDSSTFVADASAVLWEEAVLSLGVRDVRAFRENVAVQFDDGGTTPFEPSLGVVAGSETGIHAAVPTAQNGFAFSIPLGLSGSRSLLFTPSGRDSQISLVSNWSDPSFTGAFLPDERRIHAEGFAAEWRIPHLTRSVPQSWLLSQYHLDALNSSEFGVRFFQPVDFYHLVNRSLKYAVLFIVIVFAGIFVLETLSRSRVHTLQYLFVGLSQIVFYLLLLSFSEHLGFAPAYGIAVAGTVCLITLYTGIILRSLIHGFVMFVVLCITYGLLYFLLRLEDYALLVGSVAVFMLLAITMFTTLRLDWYGVKKT